MLLAFYLRVLFYRLIFDRIIQHFGLVRLIIRKKERKRERKRGGICEIEKKVIKRMSGGKREGGQGERDRSDRVAYNVVAGS